MARSGAIPEKWGVAIIAISVLGPYFMIMSLELRATRDPHRRMPARVPTALARPLSDIHVDGRLSDRPNSLVEYAVLQHGGAYGPTDIDEGDLTDSDDLEVSFRVGYSQSTQLIYVAVRVRDDIRTVGSRFDRTDGCEIYIDGDHSGESWTRRRMRRRRSPLPAQQYIAVPGRGSYGGRVDRANPAMGPLGGIDQTRTAMAHRREGDVTTYEWAIEAFDRFPDQRTELMPGKTVGFDVAVADKDVEGDNAAWVCWGPYAPRKYLHAHFLGDLVLGGP